MAGSLNRATLIGNLGGDPEVRHTQSGNSMVTFSLATSESWRDKATGERKDKTEWHRVVIWNEHLVKIAQEYLRKGDKVMLEGKIITRKWQDQAGNDKYSTEIVLENFGGQLIMLSSKRAGGGGSEDTAAGEESGSTSPRRDGPTPKGRKAGGDPELDDEIPF